MASDEYGGLLNTTALRKLYKVERNVIDPAKVHRINDFSRPRPTSDDLVAVLKNGHARFAYVDKTSHKAYLYGEFYGMMLSAELVQSGNKVRRLVDETYLVERGFTEGETVVRYENEHPLGDPLAICRETKKGQLGKIIACKRRGDVIGLPDRSKVAHNIDLGNVELVLPMFEIYNRNAPHNYVMYKDWMGDITNMTTEVTLLYNKQAFILLDDCRVNITRRHNVDSPKYCVPGEIIKISVADALSTKKCTWPNGPPPALRSSRRTTGTRLITVRVLKVEPASLNVRWIHSPVSVERPERVIPKENFHLLTRINMSTNYVASADRVMVRLTDADQATTLTNYNRSIDEDYRCKFEPLPTAHKKPSTSTDGPVSKSGRMDVGLEEHATPSAQTAVKLEAIPEHPAEIEEMDTTASTLPETRSRKTRYGARKKRRMAVTRATDPVHKTMRFRPAKQVFGDTFIGEVLITRSLFDVEWMNGTIERDIPGYNLVPMDPDLDQEHHLPEEVVARKESPDETEFGIILSTDQQERCTQVKWFKDVDGTPVETGIETCTLFDIMPHTRLQRLHVGSLGVVLEHQSNELRDKVFQVKQHLQTGKSRVVYLNGENAELWPSQMEPFFMEEDIMDNANPFFDGEDYDEGTSATRSSGEESSTDGDDTDEESGWRPVEAVVPQEPLFPGAYATDPSLQELLDQYLSSIPEHEAKGLVNFKASPPPFVFMNCTGPFPRILASGAYVNEVVTTPHMYPVTIEHVMERSKFAGFAANFNEPTLLLYLCSYAELQQYPIIGPLRALLRLFDALLAVDPMVEPGTLQNIFKTDTLFAEALPTDLQNYPDLVGLYTAWKEQAAPHRGEIKKFELGLICTKWLLSTRDQMLTPEHVKEFNEWVLARHPELKEECHDAEPETSGDVTTNELQNSEENEPEHESPIPSTSAGQPEKKPTVISVPTCPVGHHYLGFGVLGIPAWKKRIGKELSRLHADLPEGIFVITYEDRFDLLSAIITGPTMTPYEATPFLFDIHFPDQYPVAPPLVHYKAFSEEQLNPNLYQAGKVCTSLLGTWDGVGVEKWDSQKSNLVQVLVSIQGLILVPEPFFNEAGYEERKILPGSTDNSKRYNETAMINSLHYLIKIYNSGPREMIDVIRGEVREKWPMLRAEIDSWLAGTEQPGFPTLMSKGFQITLGRMKQRIDEMLAA